MSGVLDFLSPTAARDAGSFHPVARSSMERRFHDAGATFEERDGWLVAASVPGEDEHLEFVGVADLSHLGKLEVRTPVTVTVPVTATSGPVYPISPRRTLVLCPTADTADLHASLSADFPLVLDVTAQHGVLALVGPEADTVIRRLTHLHHFPSSGAVAHMTAHVLTQAGGYWIVYPQEYGHYLYEVAVDCAAALGGGPVGADKLGASA